MHIAALYDIHGNLPALEAVLQDVRQAKVDQIVVGGDVVPGPMPRETLGRLLDLDVPARFVHGNGELAILAQIDGARTGSITYWGTTSGARPPESIVETYRWTAAQLHPEFAQVLESWPKTLQLEIDGLGGHDLATPIRNGSRANASSISFVRAKSTMPHLETRSNHLGCRTTLNGRQ